MNENSARVLSLSGVFMIAADPENVGKTAGFAEAIPRDPKRIIVPGHMSQERISYDYSYSSVFPDYHGVVWYYKTFETLPLGAGEHCLIEFERMGYIADVWLNGQLLGEHRHHEEAVSYDITNLMKHAGENLLAVRCFEPMRDGEPIDGIRLRDIPNGSLADGEGMGNAANCIGGIIGEVRLKVVPDIYICDQWIRQDYKTGKVSVTLTVENYGDTAEKGASLLISEQKTGLCAARLRKTVTVAPGKSEILLECTVPGHKNWELKNPFLYVCEANAAGFTHNARFGFREIRLENGFFTLNGNRFLLKCAHGCLTAQTCVTMKAMGFNAFRSIHRVMDREVMDLCDELGFLILESPISSWGMREHENARAMVEAYTVNMVKMHRNHPSVGAFYIYNETASKLLTQYAVELMPKLRSLDPGNLFLLSSGRWDNDASVASASNPGSPTFDTPLYGECRADLADKTFGGVPGLATLSSPVGDLHPYHNVPMTPEAAQWFRTVGQGYNPVFISEFGMGSQNNPVSSTLNAEALHTLRPGFPESCPRPDEEVAWVLGMPPRKLWEETEQFLDRYDLRALYPFSDLLCVEADRLNGRQREQLFDLVRSNPNVCAFSLTSFGGGNEGTCEGTGLGNGIVKEGLAHVLQEGNAPLRFALFATNRVVYADRDTELEAVLCNEDRLPAGSYPMALCVDGGTPARVVAQWNTEAVYPAEKIGGFPTLAATVFRDQVRLGEEGDYTFRARLLKGDMPCGGDLAIRGVLIDDSRVRGRRVAGLGLDETTTEFLASHGIGLVSVEEAGETGVVLVGAGLDSAGKEAVSALAEKGMTVMLLDEKILVDDPGLLKAVAGEKAKVTVPNNWLYHNDCIHKNHPVFSNMTPAGFCDYETYGAMYPTAFVEGAEGFTDAAAVSFRIEVSVTSGITFGEFPFGKGKAVLNTFRLCQNLNKHPFADRMLLNIVETYAQ